MDTNQPAHSKREEWGNRFDRLRKGVKRTAPFAAGILAALIGMLLYNALVPGPAQLTANDVNETVAQALASATPPPAFSARVYEAIQPSLVLIETKADDAHHGSRDGGLGSGVVIDDAGDILTSLHVVEGATEIEVVFADGTRSRAVVIAAQPEIDIAVLSPENLPAVVVPAVLGNPNALRVGDEVYAVGNPFGLYSSMSAGVVSGFDRSFTPEGKDQTIEGLIQIDAAVNPGNSGGPLLNRDGYVMGIVTGIINPTEQSFFIGIGFAVPITTAAGGAGLPPY
ncbi:MAG: S1C family serine protease [Chloroflexota bacterium]